MATPTPEALNFSGPCDGLREEGLASLSAMNQPAMDQPMTKAAVATRPTWIVRHFWFAAAATALVAVTAPGRARAAMPFDGSWRVQIQTLSASCDRSYNLNANCYVAKPVDFFQFEKIVKAIKEFWFSIVILPPRD